MTPEVKMVITTDQGNVTMRVRATGHDLKTMSDLANHIRWCLQTLCKLEVR